MAKKRKKWQKMAKFFFWFFVFSSIKVISTVSNKRKRIAKQELRHKGLLKTLGKKPDGSVSRSLR